ncbi:MULTISPECIES: hypothetical protein [Streptomyces]|uniref:hypothetical protein n=1 Tax=Streptomyces TaxID=1883 RepID=UPI001F5D5BCD|nr:hypothetical protein [Streptomyces albidoflavus]
MSNEQIAQALVVEAATVTTHLPRLVPELGVQPRLLAAVRAYHNRVVLVDDTRRRGRLPTPAQGSGVGAAVRPKASQPRGVLLPPPPSRAPAPAPATVNLRFYAGEPLGSGTTTPSGHAHGHLRLERTQEADRHRAAVNRQRAAHQAPLPRTARPAGERTATVRTRAAPWPSVSSVDWSDGRFRASPSEDGDRPEPSGYRPALTDHFRMSLAVG